MKNPLNQYNSHYRYDPEGDIIVDLGEEKKPKKIRIKKINVFLFLGTIITTVGAGAIYLENKDIISNPLNLIYGVPYSLAILFILGAHEMGHYMMCRKHGIPATLPFFIPAPFLFGTMGAVIKIKGIMKNRKVLFDVGTAGPIAGILATIPVLIVGIYLSDFQLIPEDKSGYLYFGEPLLFKFLVFLVKGTAPANHSLNISSIALAGWAGLFVTAMNLIPVGQLDGGHIIYSFSPKNHRMISKLFTLILIPLGLIFWHGWIMWALLLIFFVRFNHPNTTFDHVPLDGKRKIIGIITLIIFILTFIYQPFYFE